MLRGAHAALPWLEATRSPTINLGSVYLTESYARTLIGPDVDLVIVPDPDFMYTTTSAPFADVIDTTRGFTATTVRRPIVLNYPLSDSDRLLLHSSFAHELGHTAVDVFALVADVMNRLDDEPRYMEALGKTVRQFKADVWPASSEARITGTLRARLRVWIEELLCDLLAVESAGPAFAWAFAVFGLPLSYGDPLVSHPPNTLRTKLMLQHLADRGWRGFMERVAPGVTRWLDEVGADAKGALPPDFAFLRDQLLAHRQILQRVAIERANDNALDVEALAAGASDAAGLLQRLILPLGSNGPLPAQAILLGGWQYAFAEHGDDPSGLVRAIADMRLQTLLGKAVEMSTVAAEWEDTQ
jgi:hypothetical protein